MKKALALILGCVLLLGCLSGCGSVEGSAMVENVGMICGIGSVGLVNRFSGVVTAGEETKISKDESFVLDEILVSVGDEVKAGDVLFTYDTEAGQLQLEKAGLELEQMQANLKALQDQKADLEKQKSKASGSLELSLSLEIRDLETQITEGEYNLKAKENEIAKLETSLQTAEVKSPIDGRIQSINENGGYDNYGNPLPFMSVVATQGYMIKGYVNETNINSVMEGTPMLLRARVGADTWTGTVLKIDYDNPAQNSNNYYSDDTGSSSKYPFYVLLDSEENLMLGQHVYIEPANGSSEEPAVGLNLPEYYIVDVDSNPFVWAQGSNGKLEKRSLQLGSYDESMGTYEVLSGLTAQDYIAWPEDTLAAGMACTTYSDEGFVEEGPSYEEAGAVAYAG